jgi:hypothetical protein
MTRKDFELIAAAIWRALDDAITDAEDDAFQRIGDLARDLAGELTKTNPAFNQARFLRACGVER